MKASVKINGRAKRGDCRTLRNWTERLDLKATVDGDQFILAGFYRALFSDDAKALRRAILAEAKRCQKDHSLRENEKESDNL